MSDTLIGSHHIRHPVQKQGRPVPNRRSGQAERLRNRNQQSEISGQQSRIMSDIDGQNGEVEMGGSI